MICGPCAKAADWIPAQSLEEIATDARRQAHLLCVGAGSCACQHRVPTPDLAEEKRRD